MSSGTKRQDEVADPESLELQETTTKSTYVKLFERKKCGNKCTMCVLIFILVMLLIVLLVTILNNPLTTGLQTLLRTTGPSIGIRLHSKDDAHDCNQAGQKKTFPDVDYAMLGYNILKGYPLAVGHDPGFTHPIFQADYSGYHQSADCRYSVPHGYTIIPDVSCVTSFSSEEVKTSYELSESLSAEAHFSAGGWGASFSASTEYNEARSELSAQQSVFVISTAFCNYYYASLNKGDSPKFDDTFESWASKLADESATDDDFFEFVDYYGTHFLTEVRFGAKYIYQHKMSVESFQELSKSDYSVSVQASYSGLFSVGGGFGLSGSQQEAASKFSKKVETKTITVGAPPPANGDALTWASTVKNTPVPTRYQLENIAILFTPKYMTDASFQYSKVHNRLNNIILNGTYCTYLHNKGLVNTCEDSAYGWVTFKQLRFSPTTSTRSREAQEGVCINSCLDDNSCFAVGFCDRSNNCGSGQNCFFKTENETYNTNQTGWNLMVFTAKMRTLRKSFSLNGIWLQNIDHRESSISASNEPECQQACQHDPKCNMYNYCDKTETNCATLTNNCLTYPIIKEIEPANIGTGFGILYIMA